MNARGATALVFFTSASVLVLEILAGRLMAPYVGVSLETFTGIIGTVLAGIAAGAWAGGVLADARDPAAMIGPALVVGGALSWLSLPIVDGLGPQLGSGPASIVLLTAAAFFAPAAVLTSVSPMVAKLRLLSLTETGAVVGGISAAGTVGALAGTFLTGFVLVAAAPTRPIVVAIGALLVLAGAWTTWMLRRQRLSTPAVALVLLAGFLGSAAQGPCQVETGYFCVRIEVDADDPSLRSLYLDRLRHAAVDLDDPTVLDIRYIRLFADVAAALPEGPLETLHVGGGGFSFPRYLQHVRPSGSDLVLEIDDELIGIAERDLGLVRTDRLQVRVGDARLALDDLVDDRFDLVIGDAFASLSVPWHLTTAEFLDEVHRVLAPNGIYAMNVIGGGDNDFARAELATLRARFAYIGVIVPEDGVPADGAANQILLASDEPLPTIEIDAADGRLVTGGELDALIGNARELRDDFAPVDQMLN